MPQATTYNSPNSINYNAPTVGDGAGSNGMMPPIYPCRYQAPVRKRRGRSVTPERLTTHCIPG
jgi:hypothetical protein